jgi:hypothetical protein
MRACFLVGTVPSGYFSASRFDIPASCSKVAACPLPIIKNDKNVPTPSHHFIQSKQGLAETKSTMSLHSNMNHAYTNKEQ